MNIRCGATWRLWRLVVVFARVTHCDGLVEHLLIAQRVGAGAGDVPQGGVKCRACRGSRGGMEGNTASGIGR